MDSNHLNAVAKSYDKAVEMGRQGIDQYENLPEWIQNDPAYARFRAIALDGEPASGQRAVKEFLSPAESMNFVDLGCCLNLMFRGYDEWPSRYMGVDISKETIQLLREYAEKKKLPIGALHLGSIHETPFEAETFDIGACIGVLEYFEREFVQRAIAEMHRIMKPRGRFVLDAPNFGSATCRVMMQVEEYMGRPERFDLSPDEFEKILTRYFDIVKREGTEEDMMLLYYLICRE